MLRYCSGWFSPPPPLDCKGGSLLEALLEADKRSMLLLFGGTGPATINYQSQGGLRNLWMTPTGVTTPESCIIAFAKDIICLIECEIKAFRTKCNLFYPDLNMFLICKKRRFNYKKDSQKMWI